MATRTLTLTATLALLLPAAAQAELAGEGFTITNTFEDTVNTGSIETGFLELEGVVVDPGLEFDGTDLGLIYDFNIDDGLYEMTLVDNSQVFDLVLPEGRFDRYYVGFDSQVVTSATIDPLSDLAEFATVELVDPGVYGIADLFSQGVTSIDLPYGGFVLTIGPGSDLSTLGSNLAVNFTTTPVPEPAAAAVTLVGLTLAALRRPRR